MRNPPAPAARIRRVAQHHGHAPLIIELVDADGHPDDCACCADAQIDPPLSWNAIGQLACAGAFVASCIAFALDAHGALAALLAPFGVRL